MSVVLQTGVMYYRENQSDDWHPLILKVDADLSSFIEDYSQRTWELGEYCRYHDVIYRCTTAIETAEAWDSTHWTATDVGEELKALNDDLDETKDTLNSLCIKGQKTAINANGTTSNISCTGLTANHKVCNWGLFSDNNLTTPLDPNNPPADITITEKADAYDITIANFTSAFYIQPTFIIPQN